MVAAEAPPVTIPVATTTTIPTVDPTTAVPVAPLGKVREADAVVSLPTPPAAPTTLLKRLASIPNVEAAELVDTGTVMVGGAPAATIGVDPGTFRNFTPKVTGASDQLWQYVAGGALAVSFYMARERGLGLGANVPVAPPAGNGQPPVQPVQHWLGAFMSVGVPGVDMVVSRSLSPELHLAPNSGVVLNAPRADPVALQNAVRRLIPTADVQLMRPGLDGIVIGGAGGSYLRAAQTTSMLTAALAEVGKPYVWGGVGPDGFDCSGLVGWAFNAASVSMPRTAAQQALAGPQVPLNKVQPGDLLFWAYDPQDPTFIDHVAIYLGNLLMVVAPQTGEQVKVVRVNTDHLVGAVRVDPATAARVGGPRWP
jgi:hypothetical protein